MTIARTICVAAFGVSAATMPAALSTTDMLPRLYTEDERKALALEGCKREFDDAAYSHFGQFGVKPWPTYYIEEEGSPPGPFAYECWNAPTLPDGSRQIFGYHLFNDPLKPPPPPPVKPEPRPEPRGAARFWLD